MLTDFAKPSSSLHHRHEKPEVIILLLPASTTARSSCGDERKKRWPSPEHCKEFLRRHFLHHSSFPSSLPYSFCSVVRADRIFTTNQPNFLPAEGQAESEIEAPALHEDVTLLLPDDSGEGKPLPSFILCVCSPMKFSPSPPRGGGAPRSFSESGRSYDSGRDRGYGDSYSARDRDRDRGRDSDRGRDGDRDRYAREPRHDDYDDRPRYRN